MRLRLKRIILFVRSVPKAAAFYRAAFGLKVLGAPGDPDWVELDGGGCRLALHRGAAGGKAGRGPKIVFGAGDVRRAREAVLRSGARLGPVRSFNGIDLCDGRDPDGNAFQISSRP